MGWIPAFAGMTAHAVLVLVLVGLTPLPAQAEALQSSDPTAQRLIQNERDAWSHYARRDIEASGRLLAEDYGDVQPDGSVLDRAGQLAFVPEATLEWHQLDQFHVFRLSLDGAIVSYRARARERGSAEEYRATVVSGWSRRKGRWLNTFYKETPIAAEPAAEAAPAGN